MFDSGILKEILTQYKLDFVQKTWKEEKYKWEAVKCFQDNWNVNASGFAEMLNRSLEKTNNLLRSYNTYPKKMILSFAQVASDEVRAMFKNLYDENIDVIERINSFKTDADKLLAKYGKQGEHHYQTENAITTYLWLRYPDKYYIFKFNEAKDVSKMIKSNYSFVKGHFADNIRNYLKLYDEINLALLKDQDLISILKSQLSDTCYPDSNLKTLTIDLCFYISKNQKNLIPNDEWFPKDYNPGFTVDQWVELLNDPNVFNQNNLEMMRRLKDIGGQATCIELAHKYGETKNFYLSGSVYLAQRIHKKTNCPTLTKDNENAKWWPILYIGRFAEKDHPGSYIWKLRDELSAALDQIDLSNVKLYSDKKITDLETPPVAISTYSRNEFLNEVFMSEEKYDSLCNALKNKMNIILQGAPGVGKTFAARRLAWSLMGEKDDNRIELVQFHQNYSYEDFVMGYKPSENGFKLKEGVFYRFCKKAEEQPEKDFFFIIDEINRGNLSKIFGELLMLIENDYRGTTITLPYSDEQFSVPNNLYIIGMMNTADRSLAMIDYALRRRFSFIEMEPAFESNGFKDYQKKLNDPKFDELINKIKDLNQEITEDKTLGKGFCIGHSYFCGQDACTEEWLSSIVDYDILPMLNEYWFDEPNKVEKWSKILLGIFR